MNTIYLLSKLSKSLYVLRSAKNILTSKPLKSQNFSLNHSHLIYCVHIWVSVAQSFVTDFFFIKQKAAIHNFTLGIMFLTMPMLKVYSNFPRFYPCHFSLYTFYCTRLHSFFTYEYLFPSYMAQKLQKTCWSLNTVPGI